MYTLGLLILSLASGHYVSEFSGWVILGLGLLVAGTFRFLLDYLNQGS